MTPVRSEFPDRVVVGIDDTDMPGTPGTGHLARLLAVGLEEAGIGRCRGVTRHQLYEGPGVPKTSHNSAAAIVMEEADAGRVEEVVTGFLVEHAADGSDPGAAVFDAVPPPAVLAFARRAQRELVKREEAEDLAAWAGLILRGLGGTRDGVIGALAAAALRTDGNDGRFVGLHGIRCLDGKMTVGEILDCSDIVAVVDEVSGLPLPAGSTLDTGGWIRPRVVDHQPFVVARRGEEGGWVHADARSHQG